MGKRTFSLASIIFLTIICCASSVKAVNWRFPVGLSYISGFSDIADLHEENLEAEGYITTSVEPVPVALAFNPYVEFDFGLGIGAGVGPLMIIAGDTDFLNLPLKLDVRYAIPKIKVSPYIRAGLSHHLASGEYVEGSTPGLFGGIGIEFLRNKMIGFGAEMSFDSAEIEFEKKYAETTATTTEKIKPCEFMISIFAVF